MKSLRTLFIAVMLSGSLATVAQRGPVSSDRQLPPDSFMDSLKVQGDYDKLAARAMGYFQNPENRHLAFSTFQQLDQFSSVLGDEFGQWTANRYLGKLYLASRDLTISRGYLNSAVAIFRRNTSDMMTNQSLADVLCDYSDTFSAEEDSARIYSDMALACAATAADSARAFFLKARIASVRQDFEEYDLCFSTLNTKFNGAPCYEDAVRELHIADEILQGRSAQYIPVIRNLPFVSKRYFVSLFRSLGDYEIADGLNQVLLDEMNEIMTNRSNELIEKLAASMQSEGMNKALLARMKGYNIALRVLGTILVLILIVVLILSFINRKLAARHLKEREEMIHQLTVANEKSRAADLAKTMFVHNMSHEIRTPLNAIVGFSQLLSLPDGMLEESEKKQYSDYVVNNSLILTMLVDDILSASDMEGGEYKVLIENTNPNDICRSAIKSTEYRTPDGVRMYMKSDFPDDYVIETDPRRVQQVLINFLSNACKHTEKGEICVGCSLDQDGGKVLFSVTDTGCGIPEDEAENIFERFTKLDSFAQGTGLGLNICREISERLGGRVYLDTSYHGGARFVLEIATA